MARTREVAMGRESQGSAHHHENEGDLPNIGHARSERYDPNSKPVYLKRRMGLGLSEVKSKK